ncbi:MAG: RNA polymerase sigma factor [Gemmatimonadetes bacterium]|nr:RNA polymerase sigma factor [Gemmatimonadota bacterium]
MLPAIKRPSAPPQSRPLLADTPHFASDLNDLVNRFSSFGRRVASRHGLDAGEVDEVLQDVRIRLWRAASSPGGVRCTNARYIHRVVVSASLDLIRRRRTRRARLVALDHLDPEDLSVDASADALLDADTLTQAVQQALLRLPPARRDAVRLGLLGHDRFEIARLMGWSVARSRNLLYRGLADLRAILEARGIAPSRAGRMGERTSPAEVTSVHCVATRPSDHPARPTRAA